MSLLADFIAPHSDSRPDPRRRSLVTSLAPWAVAMACAGMYSIAGGRSLDYDSSVTVGLFVKPARWVTPLITTHDFNNHPLFSLIEWFVWHLGGQSEAALRVAPALFGAATVWVLVSWVQRRHGTAVGVVAGVLLAANPIFAALSRSVRGYSLTTLGVVVATTWLIDHLYDDDPGISPIYVVAMGAAVATHFMSLIVVGAHVVAILVARRGRREWWMNIGGALVLGAGVLLPTMGALITAARNQPSILQPRFGLDMAEMVLGYGWLAELAIVMLLAIGVVQLGHSERARRFSLANPVTAAVAAVLAVAAVEWVALRPANLAFRFFDWLVPGVAVMAALSVVPTEHRRVRTVAIVLAVVAAGAMIASDATVWTEPVAPLREAAEWVRAHRHGGVVCGDGPVGEAFLGYSLRVEPLLDPGLASKCDLVVQVGAPSKYGVMGAVRRELPKSVRLHGSEQDVVIHHR